MREMKGLSLALVVAPIIFSGCMQEKFNTVNPSKQNSPVHETNTSKTSTEHNTTNDQNTSITTLPIEYSESNLSLDAIIELTESRELEKIMIESGLISNVSQMEADWQEITKEEEIIATAMAYLDTKYLWAANGPNAFDCSGFTKYVFKENGMTLPRYSGHQAKVGIKISFDELQKGDLVFFDTEKKYTRRVNHVGIYIGDGKFIHASSAKKKVTITSFKKHFYKNRFLWGQRIIDDRSIAYNSL